MNATDQARTLRIPPITLATYDWRAPAGTSRAQVRSFNGQWPVSPHRPRWLIRRLR